MHTEITIERNYGLKIKLHCRTFAISCYWLDGDEGTPFFLVKVIPSSKYLNKSIALVMYYAFKNLKAL